MMRMAAALSALFVLLALGGMDPAALRSLGLLTLAALAVAVLWDLLSLLRRALRRPLVIVPRRVKPQGPGRPPTIIVDGSNVMHWNGVPSELVLTRVVKQLVDKGERPHIYFDANVGYKLADRYFDNHHMAAMLALPIERVTVVDKGTPADPVLLEHAVAAGVRVLTNDRYLDWKTQFPQVGERGFLVKGRWQQGTPMLRL